MIDEAGQGSMLPVMAQVSRFLGRATGVLMLVACPAFSAAQPLRQRDAEVDRQRDTPDLVRTHREEGEAILALADNAMAGRSSPSDFGVQWQNDFIKAQRGTFVPFTLTIDVAALRRRAVLVYVRARRRPERPDQRGDRRDRNRETEGTDETSYPVDAIFPVELGANQAGMARVSRGFAVAPGAYDVFVVLRERVNPAAPRFKPKASVVRQALDVPDFWSGELTTSSIIVADGLTTLPEALPSDQLPERPYVVGRNEITPAADRVFRRNEELIVVFLVYNPMVTTERQFDVKVEYHFFRKVGARSGVDRRDRPGAESGDPVRAGSSHSVVRPGEQYFNHTEPQRFNPALMAAAFNPAGGEPVLAGQVVPLNGFEEGEYRLELQVLDLLSGKSLSRDVMFTVQP